MNVTKETIISGVVGLILGILIALVFISVTPWGGRMMYRNQMMGQIDAHFIEQMIPHHEDAITMANLALTNAKKSEIKQLAQNIVDSQSKEIDEMKGWYKDWYGGEVPQDVQVMGGHGMGGNTGMHMGMMGNETDITRLEQSADFDRAFIEEMIPHH